MNKSFNLRDLWDDLPEEPRRMLVGAAWILLGSVMLWMSITFFGRAVFEQRSKQCITYQEITGYQTQYSPDAGCFIKVEGQWMPYDVHLAQLRSNR